MSSYNQEVEELGDRQGIQRVELAIQKLALAEEQQQQNDEPETDFSDEEEAVRSGESLAARARKYLERRQKLELEGKREQDERILNHLQSKPTINDKSARLAQGRRASRNQSNVGEALYSDAHASRLNREILVQQHFENVEKDYGRPAITKQAAELVRQGPVSDRLYKDAVKKQQPSKRKSNEKKEIAVVENTSAINRSESLYLRALDSIKAREAASRAQDSIARKRAKPRLNAKTKQLAKDMGQSSTERLLSTASSSRRSSSRVHLGEQDLTFKPKINKNSVRILQQQEQQQGEPASDGESNATTSTPHDRLYSEYSQRCARRATLEAQKSTRDSETLKECTFKPSITPFASSAATGESESFVDRSLEWEQRRQSRLDAQRRAQQEAENVDRECTFKPLINTRKQQTTRNIKPKGIEQYMERQRRAREERARLAQPPSPKVKWNNKITIPIGPTLGTMERQRARKQASPPVARAAAPAPSPPPPQQLQRKPHRTPPPSPPMKSPQQTLQGLELLSSLINN